MTKQMRGDLGGILGFGGRNSEVRNTDDGASRRAEAQAPGTRSQAARKNVSDEAESDNAATQRFPRLHIAGPPRSVFLTGAI